MHRCGASLTRESFAYDARFIGLTEDVIYDVVLGSRRMYGAGCSQTSAVDDEISAVPRTSCWVPGPMATLALQRYRESGGEGRYEVVHGAK